MIYCMKLLCVVMVFTLLGIKTEKIGCEVFDERPSKRFSKRVLLSDATLAYNEVY